MLRQQSRTASEVVHGIQLLRWITPGLPAIHLEPPLWLRGLGAELASDFRWDCILIRSFAVGISRQARFAEEGLFHKLENRLAILCDHFQPCQATHHGEIDAAETKAREEDVDAIAERLIVERVDSIG